MKGLANRTTDCVVRVVIAFVLVEHAAVLSACSRRTRPIFVGAGTSAVGGVHSMFEQGDRLVAATLDEVTENSVAAALQRPPTSQSQIEQIDEPRIWPVIGL
jgi:hypothetical protein